MRDFLGVGVGDRINRGDVAFMRRTRDEHHLSGHVPRGIEVRDVRPQILVDRDVGASGLDTERLKADPVGVADPPLWSQNSSSNKQFRIIFSSDTPADVLPTDDNVTMAADNKVARTSGGTDFCTSKPVLPQAPS